MLDMIMKKLQQGGIGDSIGQAASMDALKGQAMMNSSPAMPSPVNQAITNMDQGSMASALGPNTQFSPVQAETTAQAVDGMSGFDYKGMVSGLGKAAQGAAAATPKQQMSPVDTRPQGAAGDAIMMPTGLNAGQSGAMQAMQGQNLIGGQPSREELMRRMMAG
jgi:hypothetical protein